jgi:hypothetical protein
MEMSNSQFVKMLAAMFRCKSDEKEVWSKEKITSIRDEDGLNWYLVGRNSSHQFCLAVDENDVIWKESYSAEVVPDYELISAEEYYRCLSSDNPEDWEKAHNAENCAEDRHVSQVTQETLGYLGHW